MTHLELSLTKQQTEKKYNYCVIDCQFNDWSLGIATYTDAQQFKKIDEMPKTDDMKIIILDVRDRHLYNNNKLAIFKTNMTNVEILNDKCLFANFMMLKYPNNIPQTIYNKRLTSDENSNNFVLSDYDSTKPRKMIKKISNGYAGIGVSIIYDFKDFSEQNNIIVSDYIEHNDFYSGHFVVNNGIIIEQIYFKSTTKGDKSYIQRSSISNYEILTYDTLKQHADLTIFNNIFKDLNYSGFACPNFIIVDQNIIIFEINPRPGGSLMNNKEYCKKFFNKIIDDQI